MDRNPDMRMLRTETVNDPARIARQPRMTSVNSVLQVDLFAQAKADASTVVPRIDGPVTSFQPP
jgi:acyl-CoA hydrolase